MIKIKMFLTGLLLLFLFNTNPACAADYTVAQGDSLWKISQKYDISVEKIIKINNLQSDLLAIGQVLKLDDTSKSLPTQAVTAKQNTGYTQQGTYIVQAGDTLSSIAQKIGITIEGIRNLNNIQGDMIYAGQTLVFNSSSVSRGYVDRPRNEVPQGESYSNRYGQLVDWFEEGINILKPGLKFTVTDTQTGKTMRFAVLGGSNHCDVEPLTTEDTNSMLDLFKDWTWTPRPVCVQIGGQAIAASLSGMPHTDIENISNNGVTGHFDMYLYNSQPHGSGISKSYVQQHHDAVLKAAI
ncbi:LysM peptidoglycan-binding domain-containing protein [Desulfoscipio gibsoniae]|uniref:LysM repeat-containing protein n=1 Tax=Desulfoscipio gibsoniae DSM 7213 TaxID=767817 RepID=R4KGN1_9FIRM|nr:LysM peptidoglycan-binding domain-containing protein [Desulfoscipio gibsoniae]AGK99674.1 LysM repeat-containing protein [Desulfoscipio gibsoniae DSM 7213]